MQINGAVFARNQLSYGVGLSFQPHPKATINIDVVGRRQLHGGQLGYRNFTNDSVSIDLLTPLAQPLDVVSAAPGIKWNVAGNVLVTANMLLSIANRGLRATMTPMVGFEWAYQVNAVPCGTSR